MSIELIAQQDGAEPQILDLTAGSRLSFYNHFSEVPTLVVIDLPADPELPVPIFMLSAANQASNDFAAGHGFFGRRSRPEPVIDPLSYLRSLMFERPDEVLLQTDVLTEKSEALHFGIWTDEAAFVTVTLRRVIENQSVTALSADELDEIPSTETMID